MHPLACSIVNSFLHRSAIFIRCPYVCRLISFASEAEVSGNIIYALIKVVDNFIFKRDSGTESGDESGPKLVHKILLFSIYISILLY